MGRLGKKELKERNVSEKGSAEKWERGAERLILIEPPEFANLYRPTTGNIY